MYYYPKNSGILDDLMSKFSRLFFKRIRKHIPLRSIGTTWKGATTTYTRDSSGFDSLESWWAVEELKNENDIKYFVLEK